MIFVIFSILVILHISTLIWKNLCTIWCIPAAILQNIFICLQRQQVCWHSHFQDKNIKNLKKYFWCEKKKTAL